MSDLYCKVSKTLLIVFYSLPSESLISPSWKKLDFEVPAKIII